MHDAPPPLGAAAMSTDQSFGTYLGSWAEVKRPNGHRERHEGFDLSSLLQCSGEEWSRSRARPPNGGCGRSS